MNPVNQFWDTRLVALYGLMAGYTNAELNQLHAQLLKLCDNERHYDYLGRALVRLNADNRISVSEKKVETAKGVIEKHWNADHPHPKWFTPEFDHLLEYELLMVDTEWFRKCLSDYLTLFKNNQLFQPVGLQPKSYTKQRKELFAELDKSNGKHKVTEEYLAQSTQFKLLETAYTLVEEGLIVIHDIGLVSGVNFSDLPLAEATIRLTDDEYIDTYSAATSLPETEKTWLAELKVEGQNVAVRIHGESWVVIKRLRADSGLYNFMHYMQIHPNTNVGRADIQLLDGCEAYQDMTELPRRCGFDSKLKKFFFDGTTRQNVKLTNPRVITTAERDELKRILANR